jgi:hypothetical protein
MFEADAKVVLCTDAPTVSGVTLSGEYQRALALREFTELDVLRLIDNGFSSAFLDHQLRERLRARVCEDRRDPRRQRDPPAVTHALATDRILPAGAEEVRPRLPHCEPAGRDDHLRRRATRPRALHRVDSA